MSESEDMNEFASIVERIERGEVSELAREMIYGHVRRSMLSVARWHRSGGLIKV